MGAYAAESAATIEPALRDPWTRGPERFQRHWLIAGPLTSQQIPHVDPAQMQPAPGAALSTSIPQVTWQPKTAWGDVVVVTEVLGERAAGTSRHAFAVATVRRERTAPAELALGAGGSFAVWVNGVRVHEQSDERKFQRDDVRVPIDLKAGDNQILLQLSEPTQGAWHFAARVLPPGALVVRELEIVPHVLSSVAPQLVVRTHTAEEPDRASVAVQVVGAGGRVVAERVAPRGAAVEFDFDRWRDGAYEVRLQTRDAFGARRITHLPWYKGDARAAAQMLLDTADNSASDVRGAHLRMLAQLVRERAGEHLERFAEDTPLKLHAALMEFEELQLEASGRMGTLRAGGFVRLAYRDDVDGSVQFCRAYLPADYTAENRWPLIAYLHGYNPENPPYHRWWSVDVRHSELADELNMIELQPHGRGNAQYRGIGERDVLRCIDEAKRRFAVDEDRVYLSGDSMGGHGTWWIASRNPHVFAAAAPVFGGWDFRITNVSAPASADAAPKTPEQFFATERLSSFVSAENLLNVPLWVIHGDADAAVHVDNSRHAVRLLQRWGYSVRYHEMPGWGHEDLGQRRRIAQWMVQHRRDPAPRHVRVRAADLAGARAHWVEVIEASEQQRLVRVDAHALAPGVIRVDSDNVARLRLELPEALRDGRGHARIVWNGVEHTSVARDGVIELEQGALPGRLHKRRGVQGPIGDIVNTPFVVVIGTLSSDERMREYCEQRARAIQHWWGEWQHQTPRILKDTELSAADERRYSLILIGGADANAVSKRLIGRLPFTVERDRITVDGKTYPASDAVLQAIYPNPLAPQRYVFIAAATSPQGMYLWRPSFPQVNGWDWIIQDGRRPPFGVAVEERDRYIAAGVFNSQWRRDARSTSEGDLKARSAWRLRKAPAPGFVPDQARLRAAAGSYELFPGFVITVSVANGHLLAKVPNRAQVELLPESNTAFAVPGGDALEFVADDTGTVSGVHIESDSGSFFARRLP